jgi:hypothetical protein
MREQRQKQLQYPGRFGFAFTPAFGRADAASRRFFRRGAEAPLYPRSNAKATASATANATSGWAKVYFPTLGAMKLRRRWGTRYSCLF